MQEVINPANDKPLSKEAADYVTQLREVRSSARRAARSGNPAKRFPAIKDHNSALHMIRVVYLNEASKS